MITKIKQLLSKIPYGLIPIIVPSIITIIGGTFAFLFYFKNPISLTDTKDRQILIELISNQHPECEIANVQLNSQVTLPTHTFDLIYSKSTNINDVEDIYWYVKSVNYDVISNKDTVNYDLVFEISERFLREEVNQCLFVINKESGEIIK